MYLLFFCLKPKYPYIKPNYELLRMRTIPCLIFFLCSITTLAQTSFRVMSYNVENLFDTYDNPDKEDNEFLPSGSRHWTPGRYYHKLQQIAKVITAAGGWGTPALVGLCEVENDSVLHHLTRLTPLRNQDYRFIITKSPDPRGINVALLYQRDRFGYIGHEAIPVRFSGTRHKQTRDILHVWGKIITGDTLDIYVCHFPSRYGGEKESERDRFDAARTLRTHSDSIGRARHRPLQIIMGDFNDTPHDRSIREVLSAQVLEKDSPSTDEDPLTLYNLFSTPAALSLPGSHKYQGEWSQLDQIIINSILTQTTSPIHLLPESPRIFAPSFLRIKDKTWRGVRPFRTYYGYKYEGGYSDHLPLIVDFEMIIPPSK